MQPLFAGLRQSLAALSPDTTRSARNADVATSEAGLNADLIASLPRGELDAFLPQATPPDTPVLSQPDVFIALGSSQWRDTLRGRDVYETKLVRHETLRKQALGGGRAVEGEVAIGAAAMAPGLAQRALQAGLSAAEAARLEKLLRDGRFAGDAELVTTLLETPNAANALRTLIDLELYRSMRPDRLTPDIVRALTLGVGLPRTAASEGSEGILDGTSALAAAHALACMSASDYAHMKSLLAGTWGNVADPSPTADMQTERALILKAAAARDDELSHPGKYTGKTETACMEIIRFGLQIRGMDAQQLIEHTSAIDLDGDGVDEGLQQKWQNTSAPAVLQMLRAERDPIYALSLYTQPRELKAGWWWVDKLPSTNAADEQASMLEAMETEAAPRGDERGAGSGMVLATMAHATKPGSGQAYERVPVGLSNRGKALDEIESLVRTGEGVAIAVSSTPGERHAMAITDVRFTGAGREFLVTDPWTGRTEWIANQDLLDGNIGGNVATLTDYWR
jgi:hypothetical protein